MTIRTIFRALLPAPRRRVTFRDSVSLIVFLLSFAGVCVGLDRGGVLLFARPMALSLIVAAVWIWWLSLCGFTGLTPARARLSLVTRLLLCGVLVMAIAEPRAVRTSDVVSVVYALDMSDSIGDATIDRGMEFVARQVEQKPTTDEAGLVVFGGTAAVELPPRESFPFEDVITSRVRRDATNLEQALSLSAAMLPSENRGRIVLISDGTSTGGDLTQLLDELKSRDIAVDVLPVQYQYDREVWLEQLELPQYVKVGQDYEASVIVSSLQPGTGTLTLRENGQEVASREIEFGVGKTRTSIPIPPVRPGYYEYHATIAVSPGEDNLRQNNTVMNFIYVEGAGRVLVVTDPGGEPRDSQPLIDALKASEQAVDVVDSFEFPYDTLSLMPYDCVIWVNAPQDAFDDAQMNAMHDAVRDLGTGFLMVGGPNSFGPGGFHRTPIERMLPVSMDVSQKKVLPKGALVIILHTCEFADGNTWGKRIAKEAIKVLTGQDEVGVLIYGPMGEEWLFKLTPAEQYDEMVPKINAAEIGDMPTFASTMQMGLNELKGSDAAARHMIIISDGDPTPPAPDVIDEFKRERISVSTVSIFPHGGTEIGLMGFLANVTGGRHYFPSDPNQLPSIFIKEAKTLKRVMIQEKTFEPEVGITADLLNGIDTMMPLHGYVLTSFKPGSEPILQTPLGDEPDEDENDPVLARWRYGLGASAAFTSDLTDRWGRDWMKWASFRPFIKQLVADISRVRAPGSLRMWSYTSGGEGIVMVEDFHPDYSFLDIAASISGPDERSETVALRQVSPRRYQVRIPLWGQGRYQVVVRGSGDSREESLAGGFIVPYSPEYLRFRSNPLVLEQIRETTGGLELTADASADEVFGQRDPRASSNPIFDWFLIGLAILIPFDVAARRVQIDWTLIRAIFRRPEKDGPASATMGALLQRKADVGSRLDAARGSVPQRQAPPSRPVQLPSARQTGTGGATAARPAASKPAEPGKDSASGVDATTTSRLLALKKKRQEENPDS